ncbi:MAG: hypothetical protein IPK46_03040 [Saprospiraceae bacterium]|nr:hypothetical protein [Saprospiraceae bacterium]
MYIEDLAKTVMLIDTDYLNDRIAFSYKVYEEAYPDRELGNINLANLLYRFARNSRIYSPGEAVDILFAYKIGNSILLNCEPSNVFNFMDVHNVRMESDIGDFRIISFFAEEGESTGEYFVKMLKQVYASREVSKIVVVADNELLNPPLREFARHNRKEILMLRGYRNTRIDDDIPFNFVNINNIIPLDMGIKEGEL